MPLIHLLPMVNSSIRTKFEHDFRGCLDVLNTRRRQPHRAVAGGRRASGQGRLLEAGRGAHGLDWPG